MALKSTITGVVSLIIALVVGLIIAAYVFPVGMDEFFETNATEEWGTASSAIYELLPIFAVLSLLMAFIGILLASLDY